MNLSDLTLAEIEEIEQASRLPITAVDDPKAPKARLLASIAFVVTRRTDPAFSWEQAQAMTMEQVTALIAGSTDDDPTGATPPTE